MLDYRQVRNERQWRATTGLSEQQFYLLCHHFGNMYESSHGYSLSAMAARVHADLLLKTYEDCLFFVLFELKNGLSYDSLGLLINSDCSVAQRNFENYLHTLSLTLEIQGLMPVRNFNDVADFKQKIAQAKTIILDVSEQPTERPKNDELQKEMYSGKKRDTLIKS